MFNPLFLFKKRKSIVARLKEIPTNIQWRIIHSFLKKGFLYHPDYEKIQNIDGINKGKVGFLVGNGPSVEFADLEKLSACKDVVTFSANRIHLCYKDTSYRPNYVVTADKQVIEDFGHEILVNNTDRKVFFASMTRPALQYENLTWLKLKNGRPFVFSHDISSFVMCGGGSLNLALQVGYKMGIRKFYLYGVDHDFIFEKNVNKSGYEAKGEGNHFIKNYRAGKTWQAPRMELVEETFIKSCKVLKGEGGFLINATRGGKLEVLAREDFDVVVDKYLAKE